ncbi:MAG TPA: DUF2852 domain-containing protein [Acetobacteraceae bacterium]|nr:DUF2852 domain-containing protein [Acetobacteraceae bacterium]
MGGAPWAPGPGGPWGDPGGNAGGSPDGAAWYWHGHWRHATRPLWIVATILGFMFWWPVGLAVLFFTIGSRRMGCWGYGRRGGFQGGGYQGGWQGGGAPPWANWKSFWNCGSGRAHAQAAPSSGNRAFDEYRAETLRRLEEEQKEFGTFLDRLRFAKDKAEFDQFMTELRQRPPAAPDHTQGPSPQG